MSSPLQTMLQADAEKDAEMERLRRIEMEVRLRRDNPPSHRAAKIPPKYYIHYYNHFDFISELLERVDKLEATVEELRKQ